MSDAQLKIFCIEDDADTRELITFVFSQAGYEVESCSQPNCLEQLRDKKFAAIILDNYFIDIRGTDLCREIRSFDPVTPVIFFSGEARRTEINLALAAGANAYLVKPHDFEKLTETVARLIEEPRASSLTI